MAECEFDLILEEWADREWEELANAPEFETSKRHDRAMRRIFKRYERNTRKLRPHPEVKVGAVTKKVLIVVLAVFLALIAGCAATYFISGFRGTVYADCVEIFFYNGIDNCPNDIESAYYLSELSEDYEIMQYNNTPDCKSTLYRNTKTDQRIRFKYCVKSRYNIPMYFDTENGKLSEIEINGCYGLYHENFKPSESEAFRLLELYPINSDNCIINSFIWDNGDYIFEIYSDLPKKDVMNLAKSAKVL